MRPTPRTTPDRWARLNRVYPETASVPGPRNPDLTPYTIPFGRAVASRRWRKCVLVMFSQGGKSETLLDIIGQRLDQSPVPMIYVGPTAQFLNEQFEPRIMDLLDQAPSLRNKVIRGRKMKITRKVIAGVPLRLAHGSSSSALKSDPFGLAITDEADELMANVKGQGDPIGLIDRRGDTYPDFVHAIVSTTSRAKAETYLDPDTKLEFWRFNPNVRDGEVPSRVWQEFQNGTMLHWAWPCPHCDEYFIPRFKCLEIPTGRTPAEVREMAHLICPRCGCVITDEHKEEMNAKGLAVAPGQRIVDGEVVGDLPPNAIWSMWASGLANPFKTFGELAEAYVLAREGGTDGTVQTVINGMFGEPYWEGFDGKTDQWQLIQQRKAPYYIADKDRPNGEIPAEVVCLVAGVDVQKMSLRYVFRGFGARARSWLIEAGQLNGPTAEPEIWDDLADLIMTPRDGMIPRLVMVDSGFRPDKKEQGDVHKVYDFARRYPQFVVACKGKDQLMTGRPIIIRDHEVTTVGRAAPFSIKLATLDTDYLKSLVWSRILTEPPQPGSFFVPLNVTEAYCREVASEIRKFEDGKPKWIPINRENHFLDAEALCAAAGYLLNVQRIPEGAGRARIDEDHLPVRRDNPPPRQAPTPPPVRRSSYLGGGSGYLSR